VGHQFGAVREQGAVGHQFGAVREQGAAGQFEAEREQGAAVHPITIRFNGVTYANIREQADMEGKSFAKLVNEIIAAYFEEKTEAVML
jgi:iron-sulfur cluster repair protein YtfE (RIC family)